jgi:ABC-type multidrug transport system ATPase subunit
LTELLAALRDAKRTYPGRIALDVKTLEIFENDSIALYGQNGSGKSTLLRVLCGITALSSGTLQTTPRWRNARIAYCPQIGGLHNDLTLNENISLMRRRIPLTSSNSLYRELMDAVDLSKARDVEIRRLSGGYQKLAMLTVALAMKAEILILDEPTADLHPSYIEKLAAVVRQAPDFYLAVVFADHSKAFIELARRKIELA